ncbi:MBL fold metallo-hydrolase [Paenibacillus silvisoli]|uniref:MBL fold metallo-hydrolase n=1 Tax=Paenibacillus silvisoli TaxID=3110539 RepID=UPI0028038914|nr:MBL fold metallo-hydrolase [Paenibacillus silvisoli]
MLVHNGLAMLNITATVMGRSETIHPALVWSDTKAVLIDTGYPGQLPLIQEALRQEGLRPEQLTDIIITHQDIDHIGSLPALLSSNASDISIEVWSSPIEKPYIQGEKMLIKISPDAIDQAVAALPPDVPEEKRRAFRYALEHPPKAAVTQLLGYGESGTPIPGFIVIDTPGHTPGHISLYHETSRTLIAADALTVADGQLQGPRFNADNDEAIRSMKRFFDYPIDQVICYHGGLFRGNVHARLRELLA